MSAKYTIRRGPHGDYSPVYDVLNPSGVPIARGCSWRVARKIADALNELPRLQRALEEIAQPYCQKFTSGIGACYRFGDRTELHDERGEYISVCHSCFANRTLGAVSLQEEA